MNAYCPNCNAPVDQNAAECPNCSALFTEGSNWIPTLVPKGPVPSFEPREKRTRPVAPPSVAFLASPKILLAYIPLLFVAAIHVSGGWVLMVYMFAPHYVLLYGLPLALGAAVITYGVVEGVGQILNRFAPLTIAKHLAAGGVTALILGCLPARIRQHLIDPRDLLLEEYAAATVFYAAYVYLAIAIWWLSYATRRKNGERPGPTLATTVVSLGLLCLPFLIYVVAQTSRVHDAVRTGDLEKVASALKPWKSLDGRNREGRTLLSLAMASNKPVVAKFLVERGASIQFETRAGEKIDHLAQAISYRRSEFVDLFLSRSGSSDGGAAIKAAASSRDPKTLARLIERGMRPDGEALRVAIEQGSRDAVRLLVENGAPVNVQFRDGRAPLFLAVGLSPKIAHRLEIAELLLDHGADVAATTSDNRTAFSVALHALPTTDVQMLELLLRRGYPAQARTDGRTQLYYAARAKRPEAVRLLLKYGADPNDRARECQPEAYCFGSRTALHEAASFNGGPGKYGSASAEVVALLLKHGAKVNVVDEGGNTPLYAAAYTGNLAAAEELLKAGANPNVGRPDRRIIHVARTQIGFDDLLRKYGFSE